MGAAFGWSPRVTEDQTLWEVIAYIDGHNRANESRVEPPTDEEFEEMLEQHHVRTLN